ncbi:MAG: hypothetical protein EA425_11290 [Puniceicoccaceae bacterium]|nr:MAG: hypothetical protein EA425_11290 [Puniceicoccaceae bacterium]
MKTPYREPQVEEGIHNLIFQNRCGNRLSLLIHEEETGLEFVYKPNAFRRKDFRARNFSNRDNQTTLFAAAGLPDLRAAWYRKFDYDPFVTRLGLEAESGAKNTITIVSVADENVFALAARQPLLLALRPHRAFAVRDGLLTERWEDRGEELVSFVAYRSHELNRYRVLEDGTHLLQLVENDVVLIGGEENPAQVERVLQRLRGKALQALIDENETIVGRTLAGGLVELENAPAQRVLELNRRIAFSGIDEGGACFGALNRIYYLIWVRDGSMTACHMALSGVPAFLERWAPFLLNNPSWTRQEDGRVIPEFGQMVGTRWSKSEDDGLFYAAWTLYTHFETTGDDRMLRGPEFPLLLECIDRQIEKCWDERRGMMGSDTLGEDSLSSSPYFGYDIVNGRTTRHRHSAMPEDRPLHRCHSLYHQVNTLNTLLMARVLLARLREGDAARARRYQALCQRLRQTLRDVFPGPDGKLRSLCFTYTDGSEAWKSWPDQVDFWEHTWALCQGPFAFDPARQLEGAREVRETWAGLPGRSYGYCPWNVMTRYLREHGESSAAHQELLADEVEEALLQTKKFPLSGALTEDHRNPEGWRGLPFSAGSFTLAETALVLNPLPMGLAVRGSAAARRLHGYRHRLYSIDVELDGTGDDVAEFRVNGRTFRICLQVAQAALRPGHNRIEVRRGAAEGPRLWASDAELLEAEESDGVLGALFSSPIEKRFWIEQAAGDFRLQLRDAGGEPVEITRRETLPGTRMTVIETDAAGEIRLELGRL